MMGYHTLKKYDAVLYAVSIQYRYVTDRRTDSIAVSISRTIKTYNQRNWILIESTGMCRKSFSDYLRHNLK